jgi:hypothetical protein
VAAFYDVRSSLNMRWSLLVDDGKEVWEKPGSFKATLRCQIHVEVSNLQMCFKQTIKFTVI